MKFSIGDAVVSKATGEEGEVVAILDNQTVEVLFGNVRTPVAVNMLEHPYFNRFRKEALGKQKQKSADEAWLDDIDQEVKKAAIQKKVEDQLTAEGNWHAKRILLKIFPDFQMVGMEEQIGAFRLFLVNSSALTIDFAYKMWNGEDFSFDFKGQLHAGQNYLLHVVPFEDFAAGVSIQMLCETAEEKFQLIDLKFKPKKISEWIHTLRLGNIPSMDVTLELEKRQNAIPQAVGLSVKKKTQTIHGLQNLGHLYFDATLDLHADQLKVPTKGLSSAEIFQIQMNTFERFLSDAVQHHVKHITVIHGLGKGILREEIHKVLKRKSFVKAFDNDYNRRYGYGATHIELKD